MIMANGPYRTENLKSMMTSSNGTFSALLAICAGNSPVTGEFSAQRPVTRSFDVFFDLRLNKRLRKQSWGWCFETLSRPLWRHCVIISFIIAQVLLILVLFSAKCLLLIVIFASRTVWAFVFLVQFVPVSYIFEYPHRQCTCQVNEQNRVTNHGHLFTHSIYSIHALNTSHFCHQTFIYLAGMLPVITPLSEPFAVLCWIYWIPHICSTDVSPSIPLSNHVYIIISSLIPMRVPV